MTRSFLTLCCTKVAQGGHGMVEAIAGDLMDHQTSTESVNLLGGTHPGSHEFSVYDNKILFSSFSHLRFYFF